jgi:hypothetical protein
MSLTRRSFLGISMLACAVPLPIMETLAQSSTSWEPRLKLISNSGSPLITTQHQDAAGIKFGFEGGRVIRVNSTYHLFTSEMVSDPIWVKMKLGHWQSPDGIKWRRVSTLYESSGEYIGKDPRAALWSPEPAYDDQEQRWNLFYVAYRSAPNSADDLRLNYHGEIWRARSVTSGETGVAGPYQDDAVVLHPGPDSDSWEGFQGTDSFCPYRVGKTWYAFYGSATVTLSESTRVRKPPYWRVGLATAPCIGGPWKRLSSMNPVPIEKTFIENPIVTEIAGGGFVCVYDSQEPNVVGYAFSDDGVHWQPGRSLPVQSQLGVWSWDVRTPLGLVLEGSNEYSIYYTGSERVPDWNKLLTGNGEGYRFAIGRAMVRLERR